MPYQQNIHVSFKYPVHFTQGIFTRTSKTLPNAVGKKHRCLFYIDRNVHKHHPHVKPFVEKKYKTKCFITLGGEAIKNDIQGIQRIGQHIKDAKLDRHGAIVIIGGGAVLDAIGFAASITHRGMRQIRIPTTVLSQNDSGVGVKTGVNAYQSKNFFGTFAPPSVVINDANFLTTLHKRDWIGGCAEAFKVAIIKDLPFLNWLDRNATKIVNRDLAPMKTLVKRCAVLHLDHIREGGDPFETGSSRPLDFGHWSAHKLEMLTDNTLRHGEAVAIGVALDLVIAGNLNLISSDQLEFTLNAMQKFTLPLYHPLLETPQLLHGIQEFREHIGGELCLTFPNPLGQKTELNKLTTPTIKKAIKQLKSLVT